MVTREGERERERQSESPRAHARKTIMMDKLRLVPHVRSERKRQGRETAAKRGALLSRPVKGREEEGEKKRKERKERRRKRRMEGGGEKTRGMLARVPQYSTILRRSTSFL